LKAHPACAACGLMRPSILHPLARRRTILNVHHIKPFHLFPALELDETNLITLCRSGEDHHLMVGHLGDWSNWNPNVVRDAALLRVRLRSIV
jgi:hypothetical protein